MDAKTHNRIQSTAFLLILLAASIIFAVYFYFFHETAINAPPKQMQAGTLLEVPKAIQAFTLKDDKGKPFSNSNLLNQWTFMFFGFTHCPHICPTTMYELQKTYEMIASKQITPPQVVFISIDPERDTKARLHAYVTAFNKNFIGATGSHTALSKLTDDLKILYIKTQVKGNSEDYNIDHSGSILLFNPQGKLAAIFSTPLYADLIARDYADLVKQYH